MFRFRVKLKFGAWNVWIEGPLDRWLEKAEHVKKYTDIPNQTEWFGQVSAVNVKMALVRVQHLVPELQEE